MQDGMHNYVQKQQKPKPAFSFSEQVRATPDLADETLPRHGIPRRGSSSFFRECFKISAARAYVSVIEVTLGYFPQRRR
jgi:hypothetical protein